MLYRRSNVSGIESCIDFVHVVALVVMAAGRSPPYYLNRRDMGLLDGVKSCIWSLMLLECVHETGFVFNDLKLDNLMIGYSDELPKTNKLSTDRTID